MSAVGIGVSDLDRSVRFYTEVMEMQAPLACGHVARATLTNTELVEG